MLVRVSAKADITRRRYHVGSVPLYVKSVECVQGRPETARSAGTIAERTISGEVETGSAVVPAVRITGGQ